MVIETTITLDPISEAEIVKVLMSTEDWVVVNQTSTTVTFSHLSNQKFYTTQTTKEVQS